MHCPTSRAVEHSRTATPHATSTARGFLTTAVRRLHPSLAIQTLTVSPKSAACPAVPIPVSAKVAREPAKLRVARPAALQTSAANPTVTAAPPRATRAFNAPATSAAPPRAATSRWTRTAAPKSAAKRASRVRSTIAARPLVATRTSARRSLARRTPTATAATASAPGATSRSSPAPSRPPADGRRHVSAAPARRSSAGLKSCSYPQP